MNEYGKDPQNLIHFSDIHVDEFMHYQYLPVLMNGDTFTPDFRLPDRLETLYPLVEMALTWELNAVGQQFQYMYVTAKRGVATPGNALNRPGYHCDGFGTEDINYIWIDGIGTRVCTQEFENVSASHLASMSQFEDQVREENVWELESKMFYRFDPYVVHAVPIIPETQMRTFVRISLSNEKYNLTGNSHNYLFDYEWEMHDRSVVRNDTTYGEADYVKD